MCKKNILIVIIAGILILTKNPAIISADGEAIYADAEIEDTSKAYVLMEAGTGAVLQSKSEEECVPIGTLNKIMTVLLVEEAIDGGKLTLDTEVRASPYANSMKQAVIWLNVGEKMRVEDLLKGVIIGNANDASVALAEAVAGTERDFVIRMNVRAKEIGMVNTIFKNCTGYDEDGQYSTAYDVAVMTRELIKHEGLHRYMTCWMDSLRSGATELVNTNRLVRTYDGIIGVKAGNSDAAGNCLSAAAKRKDVTYISIVLGSCDKDSVFAEGKKLLNIGFSGYQIIKPDLPDELSAPFPVSGGVGKEILIYVRDFKDLVIPNGSFKNIRCEYKINEQIEAPVEINQKIGEITFYLNDKELYKTDLVSINKVEKMTFFKALGILTRNLFTF